MSNVQNFLNHTSHNYQVESLEQISDITLNFEEKLRHDIFSTHFTTEEVKQRFAAPPDYLQFISAISFLSEDAGDGYPWFWILGAESAYENTELAYTEFIEDQEYHQLAKPPLMVIEIGGWSDKHVFFLSCDKMHHWGEVYDCHDAYMYQLHSSDITYKSFLDLLQRGT